MKTLVKDLVCGMEFEPGESVARSGYRGGSYFFCSEDCKERFDRAPGTFTAQGRAFQPVERSPKQENL